MTNSNFMIQGLQTTKIMYVGPKAVAIDMVSGNHPRFRFPRGESVDVPVVVAQALLPFDCYVMVTEGTAEAFESQELRAKEMAEKAEEEALKAAALELDNQNTVVDVDGEPVDIAKLTFAEIETFCLAQELDVTRENDGGKAEDKIVFAVRVRKAYEAALAAISLS